jgi:hypothetical protein
MHCHSTPDYTSYTCISIGRTFGNEALPTPLHVGAAQFAGEP